MIDGKAIAKELKKRYGSQRKAAETMGMSESQLSQSLKLLSDNFLDRLNKLGISVDNSVKQKNSGDGTNYNLNNSTLTNSEEEIKSLKKDIERLEALIKSKDETIAALKLSIK